MASSTPRARSSWSRWPMASASRSTDSVISSTTRRGSIPVRARMAATVVTAAGSSTWRAARFTAIRPGRPGRRLLAGPLEHPPAHRHDGARLLGEGHERLRAEQAALRVLPAHERLVALHRSAWPGRRWAGGTRPSRPPRRPPARRRRAPGGRRPSCACGARRARRVPSRWPWPRTWPGRRPAARPRRSRRRRWPGRGWR